MVLNIVVWPDVVLGIEDPLKSLNKIEKRRLKWTVYIPAIAYGSAMLILSGICYYRRGGSTTVTDDERKALGLKKTSSPWVTLGWCVVDALTFSIKKIFAPIINNFVVEEIQPHIRMIQKGIKDRIEMECEKFKSEHSTECCIINCDDPTKYFSGDHEKYVKKLELVLESDVVQDYLEEKGVKVKDVLKKFKDSMALDKVFLKEDNAPDIEEYFNDEGDIDFTKFATALCLEIQSDRIGCVLQEIDKAMKEIFPSDMGDFETMKSQKESNLKIIENYKDALEFFDTLPTTPPVNKYAMGQFSVPLWATKQGLTEALGEDSRMSGKISSLPNTINDFDSFKEYVNISIGDRDWETAP